MLIPKSRLAGKQPLRCPSLQTAPGAPQQSSVRQPPRSTTSRQGRRRVEAGFIFLSPTILFLVLEHRHIYSPVALVCCTPGSAPSRRTTSRGGRWVQQVPASARCQLGTAAMRIINTCKFYYFPRSAIVAAAPVVEGVVLMTCLNDGASKARCENTLVATQEILNPMREPGEVTESFQVQCAASACCARSSLWSARCCS